MGRIKQNYTLYKRGDIYYYKTYTPEGKRTAGKSTGKTNKTAARNYCDELLKRGELYTSDISFMAYAEHFFDDNSVFCRDRIKPLAENTLRGYRIKLRCYLLPYFGNIKLIDINYTRLKQLRIKMLEAGYSASNINSTLSCLKLIVDHAYRDRVIVENPFNFLDHLRLQEKRRDAFTLDEVVKLYALISPEFKKTILLLALTGMRISEAIGVQLEDIKQGEGFEYIDLTRQFNLGKYKPLKTGESRPVLIIPELKDCIGFEPTRLSAFYREYNLVKPNFQDAEERLLSFHALRHFFITNTKSNNYNASKVEFMAGHKLNNKIENVYTNYKPADLTELLKWQKITLEYILKNAPETLIEARQSVHSRFLNNLSN